MGEDDEAFKVTAPAFTVAEGSESPTFTAPVNTLEALLRFTVFPLPADIDVVPVTVISPVSTACFFIVSFSDITRVSELEVS